MYKQYNISLDTDVVDEFDNMRDLIPRSAYLNRLMKDEIKRVGGGK